MNVSHFWILLCLCTIYTVNCSHNNGVCYTSVSKQVSRIRYVQRSSLQTYSCTQGWRHTTCVRILYHQHSVTTYSVAYSSQFGCCPGYYQLGNTHPTCRPICRDSCANGGTCTSPNTCTCQTGWTGHNCHTAVCPGGCGNGTCVSPNTCVCQPGWTGNNCQTDINECANSHANNCEQQCHNTQGSYLCSCDPEHKLITNGYTCVALCPSGCGNGGTCISHSCVCAPGWTGHFCHSDMNECSSSSSNNCQHRCHNTVGSYTCSCNPGYTLKSDGRGCVAICPGGCANGGTCASPNTCVCAPGWMGSNCLTDINECTSSHNGCQHQCHNTQGSYTCSCHSGHTLHEDDHACEDINECASSHTNNCQQLCINNPGSYTCGCSTGYTLNSNGHTCTAQCPGGCANGGTCISHNTCACAPGWTGSRCQSDINECSSSHTNGCQQYCHNTQGSYTCSCYSYMSLNPDGRTCVLLWGWGYGF